MSRKPVLDLSKKYATVHGHSNSFPGACYEQNGIVFNAGHQPLNYEPDGKEEIPAPPLEDELKEDPAISALRLKLLAAENARDANPTPGKKAMVTKLTKQIEQAIKLNEE